MTPSTSGGGSPAAGSGPSALTCSTRPRSDAPRGPRHVLLGHVEQRRDGVEVGIGLRADRAAPLTGRQPAPLQTGAVPCLPQRVARVCAVGLAAPRGREHGAHPPQWTSRDRLTHQAVSDSSASTSSSPKSRGGLAAIGAAQRPAQLPQRHRVDPADRPGQQLAARGRRPTRRPRPPAPSASPAPQPVRPAAHPTAASPPVHPRRSARGTAPRRSAAPSGRSRPSATTAPRRRGGLCAARRRPAPTRRAATRPPARTPNPGAPPCRPVHGPRPRRATAARCR